MQKHRNSSRTKAAPGGRKPAAHAPAKSAAQDSDTYEACMRVYRWASKRYRKTLDALAK